VEDQSQPPAGLVCVDVRVALPEQPRADRIVPTDPAVYLCLHGAPPGQHLRLDKRSPDRLRGRLAAQGLDVATLRLAHWFPSLPDEIVILPNIGPGREDYRVTPTADTASVAVTVGAGAVVPDRPAAA
jgi:hypothetical protein